MYGDGKTPGQEARDSAYMLTWVLLGCLVSIMGGVAWLLLR